MEVCEIGRNLPKLIKSTSFSKLTLLLSLFKVYNIIPIRRVVFKSILLKF